MSCRIYQSPGRVRVRLSTLKSAIPCDLVADLKALHGVRSVLSNELTGSIVIYYDRDIRCSSSLLRIFRQYGLLQNVIGFPNRSALAIVPEEKPASLLEVVNEFLKKALKTRPLA
ncbi:MAG: hypothetical protein EOP04_29870 [Proteobacteria bacterium]|nr:MAG: hypothetical protein EOP04_29870 [Pseudomonadota bacterium]